MQHFDLKNIKDKIFVCLGTPKHSLDCVAPEIGMILIKTTHCTVFGTTKRPITKQNFKDFKHLLSIYKEMGYKIIVLDSCYFKTDKNTSFSINTTPIHGIGDISIRINVYDPFIKVPHWLRKIFVNKKDIVFARANMNKAIETILSLLNGEENDSSQ